MSNRLLLNRDRAAPAAGMACNSLPPTPAVPGTAIRAAWRRYRSRQRIAHLDGHLLKDIGVSFAEAEAEANKPFWRG